MKMLLLVILLVPSLAFAAPKAINGTWKGKFTLRVSTCPLNLTNEILAGAQIQKAKTYKIKKQGGAFIKTNGNVKSFSLFNKSYCDSGSVIDFLGTTGYPCNVIYNECVASSGPILYSSKGATITCYDSLGNFEACNITLGGSLAKKKKK